MAFAYCILHIFAFVKKDETEEKEESRQDRGNEENEKSRKKMKVQLETT